MKTQIKKMSVLLAATVLVVVASAGFFYLHKEDLDTRVQFTLLDQTGASRNEKSYQGQYLLVFFGFTSCKHICPAGMASVTRISQKLEELGFRDRHKPLFISVDAPRDSVEEVANFVNRFHPRFDGLTGNASMLERASASFGAYSAKQEGIDGDYEVAHSTMIYLVDPYSRVVNAYSMNADVDETVNSILEHLK